MWRDPLARSARPGGGRRLAGRAARRSGRSRCRRSTPSARPAWSARLRLAKLLAGHRGRPALAVDALVAAVVAFSQLAHELGDLLEAVDVNPLIVGPDGVVAVDALVVPR